MSIHGQIETNDFCKLLMDLSRLGFGQDKLSGFAKVLELLAEQVQASSCVLWEVGPRKNRSDTHENRLYVVCEWVDGSRIIGIHDLPVNESAVGRALKNNAPFFIDDVRQDPVIASRRSILQKKGIVVLASLPVIFSDKKPGVLSLYRRIKKPFTNNEKEYLKQAAPLVAALFQMLRNRVGFELIQKTGQLLGNFEPAPWSEKAPDKKVAKASKKQILEATNKMTALIQKTLHVLDVSIFLRDPQVCPNVAKLVATTWPRPELKEEIPFNKDAGLIAWVLCENKPLNILDLNTFDKDRRKIEKLYPGLQWGNLAEMKIKVLGHTAFRKKEPSPFSLIIVPIALAGQVYGAISCFVAMRAPYIYASREVALLETLAGQLGDFWLSWLLRRSLERENSSWSSMVDCLETLNEMALRELISKKPDEKLILKQTLATLRQIIEGADILDVRLLDQQKTQLSFVETLGDKWQDGLDSSKNQKPKKIDRVFPINHGSPRSVGEQVLQTGKTCHIKWNERSQYPYYQPTFEETREIIVSPIRVGIENLGVLDLRTTSLNGFPEYAPRIATILGQHLGLHLHSIQASSELKKKPKRSNPDLSGFFTSGERTCFPCF